jgi:hypothetical protein
MTVLKLLKTWKDVWSTSSKMNPFPVALDTALEEHGSSIMHLHTILAMLANKKSPLTKHETSLLEFWQRVKYVQESAILDATLTTGNVAGHIFVLKAKHGYAETNKIEQTGSTKVTVDWGDA